MAPAISQYHHYIPRFILKRFAYDFKQSEVFRDKQEGLLHVLDMPTQKFSRGEVSRTCGTQNLYLNPQDSQPMRIEKLLSDLESRTSQVFDRIHKAVEENRDHIEILEKDVHVLFKFLNISLKRSTQNRDEVKNPYRENDFMFQQMFAASGDDGQPASPAQFWLNDLLYLLQTSHDDLVKDAGSRENPAARTYEYFVNSHRLQIWKAAQGHEFFLNERIIDFEGHTESYLGTERLGTGTSHQLTWMTTDDMIHLMLPISPNVAMVFCNEFKCWDSPFADSMHALKIPYPQNSVLKSAPHKDVVGVDKPSETRGKKTWPATVAWKVHIGVLSRSHHEIISSYSLCHAKSFLICRSRECFERAKRNVPQFSKALVAQWESQGIRCEPPPRERQGDQRFDTVLREDQLKRIVDDHLSALEKMVRIITTTQQPLQRTKENLLKSWLAVRALNAYTRNDAASSSVELDSEPLVEDRAHSAVKAAFEAEYPQKPPNHRKLVTIDFWEFFNYGLGDTKFAELSLSIASKIGELIRWDSFSTHWPTHVSTLQPPTQSQSRTGHDSGDTNEKSKIKCHDNPAFPSIFEAAQEFEILEWMFEERQDILAEFVHQLAVPMKDLQPEMVRVRGRRE